VYKAVNPDGTQTETAWNSGPAPAGTPAGAFVNPYPQYTVHTVGSKAKGLSVIKDSNGNTTSAVEYDWFSSSLLGRQNNVITGIPGYFLRATTSTYYAAASNPEYWDHDAPAYLRATHTTSAGNATTSYVYDNPLTTANLTGEARWDSVSNGIISRSWTYVLPGGLVNGNIVTATDPNAIVTRTLYDGWNLYPTEVDVALGRPEQRTTHFTHDFASGLLLGSTDDNQVAMTYTYDNLGRQTRVAEAGGGGLSRTTSTHYDDLARSVATTQDQAQLTSTTYYDPLGRVRLTTDAAGNKVQKAYRAGMTGVSYDLESNPYTSIDQTMGWTLVTRNVSAT
jgi:YD repeat-containing protein